jgi:hypothetical protein
VAGGNYNVNSSTAGGVQGQIETGCIFLLSQIVMPILQGFKLFLFLHINHLNGSGCNTYHRFTLCNLKREREYQTTAEEEVNMESSERNYISGLGGKRAHFVQTLTGWPF